MQAEFAVLVACYMLLVYDTSCLKCCSLLHDLDVVLFEEEGHQLPLALARLWEILPKSEFNQIVVDPYMLSCSTLGKTNLRNIDYAVMVRISYAVHAWSAFTSREFSPTRQFLRAKLICISRALASK